MKRPQSPNLVLDRALTALAHGIDRAHMAAERATFLCVIVVGRRLYGQLGPVAFDGPSLWDAYRAFAVSVQAPKGLRPAADGGNEGVQHAFHAAAMAVATWGKQHHLPTVCLLQAHNVQDTPDASVVYTDGTWAYWMTAFETLERLGQIFCPPDHRRSRRNLTAALADYDRDHRRSSACSTKHWTPV